MSNESKREEIQTITPGDLQACDFFPPGEGWNKTTDAEELKRKAAQFERSQDDDFASDGGRPH